MKANALVFNASKPLHKPWMNPVRHLKSLIPALAQLGFIRGIPARRKGACTGLFQVLPALSARRSMRVFTRRVRLNSKFPWEIQSVSCVSLSPWELFILQDTCRTFPQACTLIRAILAPLSQKPQLHHEDQSCFTRLAIQILCQDGHK